MGSRVPTASSVRPTTITPKLFLPKDFDCPVCFETKRDIVEWGYLECGHVFCLKCLEKYYITHADFEAHERDPEKAPAKTCPTCRQGSPFFHRIDALPPEQQVTIYKQMSPDEPSPSPRTTGTGSAPPPLRPPTPTAAPGSTPPPPRTINMLRFICATAVALVERSLAPSPHPVARCSHCKLVPFSYASPGYNCVRCLKRICEYCSERIDASLSVRMCHVHIYRDDNPHAR